MSAAFSFGPLGAMTDLVVAPSVQVDNGRELKTVTTSRGVRWAQRARRNPRTWTVSRPWRDPQFARLLSLAASGLGGDMYLYDRACARQNMLPARLSAGPGALIPVGHTGQAVRTNLIPNPSFEPTRSGVTRTRCSSSANTAQVYTGTESMRLTGTGGGPAFVTIPNIAVPGVGQYTYSVMVFPSSGIGYCNVSVSFVSAATGEERVGGATGYVPVTSGKWNKLEVSAYPQGNPKSANIVINFHNETNADPEAGWVASLDAQYFSATPGQYFDGDTPSHGTTTYRWTGERGASTSEEVLGAETVVRMGAVGPSAMKVPVIVGRTYTASMWVGPGSHTGSGTRVNVPGGDPLYFPAGDASGYTYATFTAALSGLATLQVSDPATGIRIHEGLPDHRFYTSPGTPCKVAVADPEQVYQLVTDTETRIDYTVTLYEVGDTGTY